MFVILHTRFLAIAWKRTWSGPCFLREAGLTAVQIGPLVIEIAI